MPTGEDQTNYPGVLPDNSVNATNDLGFYDPAALFTAIGNRLFDDNGAGGGIANDGIQNGTEPGLSGVDVELRLTSDDSLVASATTDGTGYYYFDNLLPDQYYVEVPSTEFGSGQPLEGLLSSTGADATQTVDLNDNGIDDAAPVTNGIRTNDFTLAIGTMPTGEDQTNYPGVLPDNSVNATNDFGFYDAAALATGAIGNYVWVDENSDGYQDAGEPGLANVGVVLYDADGDSGCDHRHRQPMAATSSAACPPATTTSTCRTAPATSRTRCPPA